MVQAQSGRDLPQPGRLGHGVGRPGGAGQPLPASCGRPGQRLPDLVPARGGRLPLRRRLHGAGQRLAVHRGPGPPGVPHCTFLLEGLGGAWQATEDLLTEGGMQWAYSELFQNYGAARGGRLPGPCHPPGPAHGPLVHYSETHDNERLAGTSAAWSLLRNRLCALTSQSAAPSASPAASNGWPPRRSMCISGARPGLGGRRQPGRRAGPAQPPAHRAIPASSMGPS